MGDESIKSVQITNVGVKVLYIVKHRQIRSLAFSINTSFFLSLSQARDASTYARENEHESVFRLALPIYIHVYSMHIRVYFGNCAD